MQTFSTFFNKAKRNIRWSETYQGWDKYEQQEAQIKQYWAMRIYEHQHKALVSSTLLQRYKYAWEDMAAFVAPVLNPLKHVANIKAQTYSRAPVRRSPNQKMQMFLNRYNKAVNRSLDRANKVMNACGNVLLWPVIGPEGGESLRYRVLVFEPADVVLEPNYTDGMYDVIARYQDWYFCSFNDGSSVDGRQNWITTRGGQIDMLFSDLGSPVWCSLEDVSFGAPRCVGPVNDLISGTVSINQMEAFCERVVYLKSFKQPVSVDGEKVKVDELIAGPGRLWPTNVDTIDLVDKDSFFEELIERKVEQLANQHGVSKLAIKGDFVNEASWASVSEEMTFHFESQIENWKLIEEKLWKSTAQMELLGMDGDALVITKFVSPYPSSRDPQKDHELHRQRVTEGYESTDERILEEHPEFSDLEQAKTYRLENLTQYRDEIIMKRELNLPGYGQSPQENGAMGAAVKAAVTAVQQGNLGAEGPSMDKKEIETQLMEANNG